MYQYRLRGTETWVMSALDEGWQKALLLFIGPELGDGIEAGGVHMNRIGVVHAIAALGQRLQHDGRLGDAQIRSAVGLGGGRCLATHCRRTPYRAARRTCVLRRAWPSTRPGTLCRFWKWLQADFWESVHSSCIVGRNSVTGAWRYLRNAGRRTRC